MLPLCLLPRAGPKASAFSGRHAPNSVAEALRQKSLKYSLDIVLGIESIRLPALSFTNPWQSSRIQAPRSRLFRRPHFRFDCFYCMPPNVKQVPSNIATASAGTSVPETGVGRYLWGAVAGVVGIEGGVVSGVFNLESSGVEASDWRPRHDKHYHEA